MVQRGYEDLKIQDGMTAVVNWKKAIDKDTTKEEKAKIKSDLLDYCGRDTILMHDIINSLRLLVR